MPDKIDYSFLSGLEGGCKTTAYVPAAAVSKSGVTLATGFDLGQRSEGDLVNLGLSPVLRTKLKPYLGQKGAEAAKYLGAHPVTITLAEALSIDKAVKAAHIQSLRTKYFAAASNKTKKAFFDLPAGAQTVIASVSFQYGVNLDRVAPKFWKAATAQDWVETAKVLNNFGDAYPTRRRKEAALLGRITK